MQRHGGPHTYDTTQCKEEHTSNAMKSLRCASTSETSQVRAHDKVFRSILLILSNSCSESKVDGQDRAHLLGNSVFRHAGPYASHRSAQEMCEKSPGGDPPLPPQS